MAELPPKDVCPKCGERGCVRLALAGPTGVSPFDHPCRCPSCGAVSRYCTLLRYAASERAEHERRCAERAKARKREWYERNRDEARRRQICDREKRRAAARRRYRESPDARAKANRGSAEWNASHPERRREINRRHYEAHRHEINARKKRRRLEKLREEKANGLRQAR